jgi:hypothetical protein
MWYNTGRMSTNKKEKECFQEVLEKVQAAFQKRIRVIEEK